MSDSSLRNRLASLPLPGDFIVAGEHGRGEVIALLRDSVVVAVGSGDEVRMPLDTVSCMPAADDKARETSDARAARSQTRTLPVVHEQAHVDKRTVDRGGVRVATALEERVEDLDIPLIEEEAVVERIAIGRPVDANALPGVREEGDTVVVPVLDEEVVIERRYILREEVRIRRERRERHVQERVLLRGQRVAIERFEAPPDR